MKSDYYALGLDFGTESVRCLAVDIASGEESAIAVSEYLDGVITDKLPGTSITLDHNWALQNPQNWLDSLNEVVHQVLKDGEIQPETVVGIGISFTSSTILPTTADGVPLCSLPQWSCEPHAWPKLWKHHAAQSDADLINDLARQESEPWLKRYGGLISSEWLFPKTLQIFRESRECFNSTKRFIEGGDWVVWKLVGRETRSACQAGYKALWNNVTGYPSNLFLEKLNKGFSQLTNKLGKEIYPVGTCSGGLTVEMASRLKLLPGTPVGTAIIDAHSAVAGVGVADPGKMTMVMGTSTCHMVLDQKEVFAEGAAGVVRDGIIPGYYGYESGQAAVGDIFAWITEYGVPETYHNESKKSGLSLHELLVNKATSQKVGSHGLVALDWLNGNRSVLMNSDLKGVLVGLTLKTKPEDIYRAMIEATAFGTKIIIEAYEESGLNIDELHACGGLINNPLIMQIYSDVTGRPINVASSSQTTALGAAILGSVAAGPEHGGHGSYTEAIKKMTTPAKRTYKPNWENLKIYNKIFSDYKLLHDFFGRNKSSMMKNL
jgi:L-ribulokinase|tara:strand:- start:646 stop:2289 length:1644 start_codon:yes stop_codon:yes gene_type:complete